MRHRRAGPVGFTPPPYPYDRLDALKPAAQAHEGGMVDLSIGTPCDPPPPAVVEALASSAAERGYPASIGSAAYREAAAGWMARRLGVEVAPDQLAACIGTKELVAGMPHWLRLRDPSRDTVLYPAISYPSYAMGAELAGARAVPVPVTADGRSDLDAIDPADAARALCLWVNSPANPTGHLDDLGAAAAWGRAHGVPVLSDECYVEFTWDGPGRTILEHGLDGVLAVHSLSKRSNLAGVRAGFYAGDPDLVALPLGAAQARRVHGARSGAGGRRRRVGRPGPRRRAAGPLPRTASSASPRSWAPSASTSPLPGGGFYLWAPAPTATPGRWSGAWPSDGGALVSPGEFYGPDGAGFVRVAVVQPDDRLELVARRLGVA